MPCLAESWTASEFGVLALAPSIDLASYRDIEPDGQRNLLQKMSLHTQAEELVQELLQADLPAIVQGGALAGSLPMHSACAQIVS